MELLFNDLSLHGQFQSVRDFEESVRRVMEMREAARRFRLEVHCPRIDADAQVTQELRMPQAVGRLDANVSRALMGWLTKHGPFMDDIRQHSPDDFFACGNEVVTDTAVGEAAYCRFHDIDRGLVSLVPSSWETSPLQVTWHTGNPKSVDVENYWERGPLQRALEDTAPPMKTWRDLEEVARRQYTALTFAENAFEPIYRHPFVSSAAEKILLVLSVLYNLKNSFNEQDGLTSEGKALHNLHFFGDKALFSDSSDTEKAQFQQELRFPNPSKAGGRLFCTWHGKVKSTVPIRVHYHWRPISANEPVYVVYVGPKITKR